MCGNVEFEYRSISTSVCCPTCGEKYATRLGVDYLSKHLGQSIQCICLECAKKQINLGRN